jgi:fatty-acyl-CoA synthase
MTLRALARFPDRRAFVWEDGSLTYRGALDLIGRLQAAMVAAGVRKGQTAAFLSANSAETWCAGVAALGLGLIATWLHPLGALADHLEVIEDAEASVLIVDPRTHAQRGGELAATAERLAIVLTMGKADFGRDVMAAADKIGAATPVDLTNADDYAIINYTGGTTGKSKGAIRRHRSSAASTLAIAADFEFPAVPRYLAAAPITHVSGTKVTPALLRGGTVHLLKGFERSGSASLDRSAGSSRSNHATRDLKLATWCASVVLPTCRAPSTATMGLWRSRDLTPVTCCRRLITVQSLP